VLSGAACDGRFRIWACSSAWLERTPDKREVDGSTPSRPTIKVSALSITGSTEYELPVCPVRDAVQGV
jgi:hypothetical protein